MQLRVVYLRPAGLPSDRVCCIDAKEGAVCDDQPFPPALHSGLVGMDLEPTLPTHETFDITEVTLTLIQATIGETVGLCLGLRPSRVCAWNSASYYAVPIFCWRTFLRSAPHLFSAVYVMFAAGFRANRAMKRC